MENKEKSPNLLIPAPNRWKKLFWISIFCHEFSRYYRQLECAGPAGGLPALC
jgi:hypothetical protein